MDISGADHWILDNPLVYSSLGKTIHQPSTFLSFL